MKIETISDFTSESMISKYLNSYERKFILRVFTALFTVYTTHIT